MPSPYLSDLPPASPDKKDHSIQDRYYREDGHGQENAKEMYEILEGEEDKE